MFRIIIISSFVLHFPHHVHGIVSLVAPTDPVLSLYVDLLRRITSSSLVVVVVIIWLNAVELPPKHPLSSTQRFRIVRAEAMNIGSTPRGVTRAAETHRNYNYCGRIIHGHPLWLDGWIVNVMVVVLVDGPRCRRPHRIMACQCKPVCIIIFRCISPHSALLHVHETCRGNSWPKSNYFRLCGTLCRNYALFARTNSHCSPYRLRFCSIRDWGVIYEELIGFQLQEIFFINVGLITAELIRKHHQVFRMWFSNCFKISSYQFHSEYS